MVDVGIDPGTHTGIAVFDLESRKLVYLGTESFWSTVDMLGGTVIITPKGNGITGTTQYMVRKIVVENPGLNGFAYARNVKGAPRVDARVQRNVGSNIRDAQLLIERLRALGYTVVENKPSRAHKWTHEDFACVTGWTGRAVSQHARDAARLVWNK